MQVLWIRGRQNHAFPCVLLGREPGFPDHPYHQLFGTFPFNHGRVGGIVATSRHGAHAHHGKDLAIIQASHVGYDPESACFGTYRRLLTDSKTRTSACGKITGILDWYRQEYAIRLMMETPELKIEPECNPHS